jgi:hypothetical protein
MLNLQLAFTVFVKISCKLANPFVFIEKRHFFGYFGSLPSFERFLDDFSRTERNVRFSRSVWIMNQQTKIFHLAYNMAHELKKNGWELGQNRGRVANYMHSFCFTDA